MEQIISWFGWEAHKEPARSDKSPSNSIEVVHLHWVWILLRCCIYIVAEKKFDNVLKTWETSFPLFSGRRIVSNFKVQNFKKRENSNFLKLCINIVCWDCSSCSSSRGHLAWWLQPRRERKMCMWNMDSQTNSNLGGKCNVYALHSAHPAIRCHFWCSSFEPLLKQSFFLFLTLLNFSLQEQLDKQLGKQEVQVC